ncbi:MAG: YwqG family protein [Bacteroidota bacterium]
MFNYLKKLFSSQPEKEHPRHEPEEPLPEADELLEKLMPEINKHAVDCIGIRTETGVPLELRDSKFGGIPFLPVGTEYPTDPKGNPMRLLAQINFAELPKLSPYPEQGLLQFYIAQDDGLYGLNYDNPTLQETWQALYFEHTNFEPRTDLNDLHPEPWEYSPLRQSPLALKFEIKKDLPAVGTLEFEQLVQPLFDKDLIDQLEDEYYELEPQPAIGHKVGGYPYFTQEDVRNLKPAFAKYQLLFQMDSDSDKIMWGDVGVANFFITPEDLAKRDFSKVIYNWDCT